VNARDWLLYNNTPSVPPGWYVRSADAIARGALVTVRAQDVAPDYAGARNFTDARDRFIKRIAANDGDSVCAEDDATRINGRTVAHRQLRPAPTRDREGPLRRCLFTSFRKAADQPPTFPPSRLSAWRRMLADAHKNATHTA